ncbi:TlpA family protein disulfide reductase [Coraliomargarita sp. W4R53]
MLKLKKSPIRYLSISGLLALLSVHPLSAERTASLGNHPAEQQTSVLTGALPDLQAHNDLGELLSLKDLCHGKYTVLAAGCLTCPEFHRGYAEVEAAKVDYAPLDVQFFFVYKSLRHPELDGYVQAQNLSERLMQLESAREKLGTTIPWLCDTMDDSLRRELGFGANSIYLISPEGEIVYATERINVASFRRALAQHVGTTDSITTVSDLNLPRQTRPQRLINEDSSTRVERPDGLTILKITPETPEDTYYVKLRVEAEPELLKTGKGRIFLGFYPDPIHGAFWNNLTEPMQYTLTLPDGGKATPAIASAQKGPGDKDSEPRQFWVSIDASAPLETMQLNLKYFACTDSLCLALSQNYLIHLEAINDGSRTFGMNRGGKRNSRK